jgi:hypothetical protein
VTQSSIFYLTCDGEVKRSRKIVSDDVTDWALIHHEGLTMVLNRGSKLCSQSPEGAALKAQLKERLDQKVDVPMTIGSEYKLFFDTRAYLTQFQAQ